MKYEVMLGGRAFEVEVDGATVRLAGRTVACRLLPVPRSPLTRLVLNGVSRTYGMIRGPEGWRIHWAGRVWSAGVADERTQSLRQRVGQTHHRHGGGVVRAPMPGLVLRLEVTEGDTVRAGAGLVVLEAMKMENEITAPAGGVVKRLLVRAGQAVEKGTELVEIGEE